MNDLRNVGRVPLRERNSLLLDRIVRPREDRAGNQFHRKAGTNLDDADRHQSPVKVEIATIAANLTGGQRVRCVIREVSLSDCVIESDYLDQLNDDILLQISAVGLSIGGRIVWRESRLAGVKLQWDAAEDAPPTDRHSIDVLV